MSYARGWRMISRPTMQSLSRSSRLLMIVAALATIGCDRVTKHVAASALAGRPGQSYLADTVRLQYAENTGGFLSLGANLPPVARTWIFTVATGLLFLAMIPVARRHMASGWQLVGVTLLFAGGFSNWIDRLMNGRVVDFLNVGIGPVRTGIFNVADVALMLGGVLVAILNRPAPSAERPTVSTSPAE